LAQCRLLCVVGRTPWSAADAPVGLVVGGTMLIPLIGSGSRGTRADQGVRPTNCRSCAKRVAWDAVLSRKVRGKRSLPIEIVNPVKQLCQRRQQRRRRSRIERDVTR